LYYKQAVVTIILAVVCKAALSLAGPMLEPMAWVAAHSIISVYYKVCAAPKMAAGVVLLQRACHLQ
jgi:hypothetical protein